VKVVKPWNFGTYNGIAHPKINICQWGIGKNYREDGRHQQDAAAHGLRAQNICNSLRVAVGSAAENCIF